MPKIVDHEARRRTFVEAAFELFLEQGLEKTTLRAVAARAGQTTGALVHYFDNKDELIQQMLGEYRKQIRDRMFDAAREPDPRVALRQILLEALPTRKSSGWGWHNWLALWHQAETDSAIRQEQRRRYREWTGRITGALKRCVADGVLPTTLDVNQEARILIALVDGFGVQYLMKEGKTPARQTVAQLDTYLDRLFKVKR